MLAQYSTWPALAQVFKLESQVTDALSAKHRAICLTPDENLPITWIKRLFLLLLEGDFLFADSATALSGSWLGI